MGFNLAGYWDRRYADGRDSGEGSRGEIARRKGELVNQVISDYAIKDLLDWGCGDGQVLRHITRDVEYTGIDVSSVVLRRTAAENSGRTFQLDPWDGTPESDQVSALSADMSLSMDVMFHMVNDSDYDRYLHNVFTSATKVVLVWATDYDGGLTARHVLRRQWTPDVAKRYPAWGLASSHPDPLEAGPYLYVRKGEQ